MVRTGSKRQTGEGIAPVRVVPSAHDYKIRLKSRGVAPRFLPIAQNSLIARTRRKRNVDGGAEAVAFAHVGHFAGAGITAVLVRRREEHAGIVVKDIIRPFRDARRNQR